MDTFGEMLEKMMQMGPEEQKAMIEKLKALCICGKCPTYDDCMRQTSELLYCNKGSSVCSVRKTGCICPTCPVSPMLGLKNAYYCARGSEREIRGI